MISPTKKPDEAPILKIVPFESDPRILVLTYATDWRLEATWSQFPRAAKHLRARWNSGDEPMPPNLIGAVFDAWASGLEIRTDSQFCGLYLFLQLFIDHRVPFVLCGASESVLSILEMFRFPSLLADSLAEAAGICNEIGPSIRNKDEESFQRIWSEHMNSFYGRSGRTAPKRVLSPAQIAELYLRSRVGEGGSPRIDPSIEQAHATE